MYWLLPTSRAVHQWSFQGFAEVTGFINQDRALLVKQYLSQGQNWYKVDLYNGQVERYVEPEATDLNQITKVPYMLSEVDKRFDNGWIKLEMIDTRKGTKREIDFNYHDHIVLGVKVFSHGIVHSESELRTSGSTAMSLEGRWLLLTRYQTKLWNSFLIWLREKTGWTWPFDSESYNFHAMVVDLVNDVKTTFPLHDDRMPHFAVHPQGLGFVAVYCERYSTLGDQQYEKPTVVEWYSLPVGLACHSIQQWCLILAAFGVPVLMMMAWNALRRKRRAPVPVPPHP